MRSTLSIVGLVSVGVFVLFGASAAGAKQFSLQIGPPSAAAPQPGSTERKVLAGLLAVRPIGCADVASVTMSATAESVDAGGRRSLPLAMAPTSVPGVWLVTSPAPSGVRVVRLVGNCAGAMAGAIVTLTPSGAYHRDGVQLVSSAPTPTQVDRALAALANHPSALSAAR